LVPQQSVFRKESGFSSAQIGECAEYKGGRWRFHPSQKMFMQRMKAETDTLFDEGVYTQHELNLSFVKMGVLKSRMNPVYCTRLSQAAASNPVPSCAIHRFHERMSQVASTGLKHGEHLRKVLHTCCCDENQQIVACRFPCARKHTRERCASSSVSCCPREQGRSSQA